VHNDQLASDFGISSEWILERSGILERRAGGSTAGLAAEACGAALQRAGCAPADVDMLVLATMTPDRTCPATATAVQESLGLRCAAFDLNAACSGFLYGLAVASGFLAMGSRRVLVVGAETMRRITSREDRNTAILFGDGAGAVLLEACDGDGDLLGWSLHSDGSQGDLVHAEFGGTMRMNGQETFRVAVRLMVEAARESLEAGGYSADEVALLVPHQANLRIIDAVAARMGVPMERVATTIRHTGNTSAASIPIALADAADSDHLQRGDLVLLVGFGAGLTSGSLLLRWNP
jgi:3-oxoacyl-[acyl-carrier-protein] synthase-3